MTNPQTTKETTVNYINATPWNESKTPWLEVMTPERDKYGRTVRYVHFTGQSTPEARGFRETTAAIVRMPKTYTEVYGKHNAYLVNIWTLVSYDNAEIAGKVTYFAKLNDAKRFAEQASAMALVVHNLTPFRFTKTTREMAA